MKQLWSPFPESQWLVILFYKSLQKSMLMLLFHFIGFFFQVQVKAAV